MMEKRWMIYGATGFTGRLIAEYAVQQGHRPVLAGRSLRKLASLAERLGLESRAASLEDGHLEEALGGMDLIVHAAGPFVHTSRSMIEACLASGAHYIDITGEIPVFLHTFSYDQAAREKGIALVSGAGFDVVPTDCLAVYASRQLPQADQIELALSGMSRTSTGTLKTVLEMLPDGGQVRRDGVLLPYHLGEGARRIRFSDRERNVVPIPAGDLITAYRSTGIPNITVYNAMPRKNILWLKRFSPVLQKALSIKPLRRLLQFISGKFAGGPDETLRRTGKAFAWVKASDPSGQQVEAWLETIEPYRFTAEAVVKGVELLLAEEIIGALSPAQAFGADFVLQIDGTQRFDRLPEQ